MRHSAAGVLLSLAATLAAQAPELRVTPAAPAGGRLDWVLLGTPGHAFLTLLDVTGGPVSYLDRTLFLGGTPLLTVLDVGVLGLGGIRVQSLTVPVSAPVGVPFYLQALTTDGAFVPRPSDGESAVVFASQHVLVQDYLDPTAMGMTGTFDATVHGRLQGAAPQRRVRNVVPNTGVPFGHPVMGPLNPHGVRQQCVYRSADLGASGVPELITAIRWRPLGAVRFDAIGAFQVRASHSQVVPDYTLDPWSGLPRFPASGLSLRIADNVKPGEQQTIVYSGGYVIDPANRQLDGYMPYPDLQRSFEYNGYDSLLLDFVVPPNTATGQNGQLVWLMVQSSAQPHSRVFTAGRFGRLVMNPDQVVDAEGGDNAWHEIQLEFVRVDSSATSQWLAAPVPQPDYHAPYVSSSIPSGASVRLEFRGATRPDGLDAGPWWTDIDAIDGRRYLQYRVHFRAAVAGIAPPSVDQIVFPIN